MRCTLTRSIAVVALVSCVSSTGCAFDATGAAEPVDPDAASAFPPAVPPGDPHHGTEVEPTAFRLREVSLRDPHLFRVSFGGGCSDITDRGPGSVNALIAASVGGDDDHDGFLDRGMVILFQPFEPETEVVEVELANARCTAPADDTTCSPLVDPVATVARSIGAPECDAPPAQNLSDYTPPVEIAAAPCFTTDPIELVPNFGLKLPSSDVVVAATYSADGQQLTGTLRGFMTEEDAEAVSLTRLLPGGAGSCADHDARDVGPGGESGWYWYFNFVAERTAFSANDL